MDEGIDKYIQAPPGDLLLLVCDWFQFSSCA